MTILPSSMFAPPSEASSSSNSYNIQSSLGHSDVTITDAEQAENTSGAPEKVTFASEEVKALSWIRASKDPEWRDICRPADVGQELQYRLARDPPLIKPENEARRLLDFFQAWVQEWELGGKGLAIINPRAAGIHDVIPPWDFGWTDGYLLDPSVPPIEKIPPAPEVNGYKLTDELCPNSGCDCEDDVCDPQTCKCINRAAECYPFADNWYQWMVNPSLSAAGRERLAAAGSKPPLRHWVYDDYGHLRAEVPEGTPIFECNQFCPCSGACKNRVVQHGKQVALAFYKTESKGWGIRALQPINKGTFVGAYGGELLTDVESERRAFTYDRKLGTTYLQMIDSHIGKVHLTKQILEKDLAERGVLGSYRGSIEKEHKLIKLITDTVSDIEVLDEYRSALELGVDPILKDAELRMEHGKLSRDEEQCAMSQAKERARARAHEKVVKARARQQKWDPSVASLPAITELDYDEPVWNWLKLDRHRQDKARKIQLIRSDMEDEQFVTVDSALLGNHTRFFNHSCDPNIHHVPVYVDNASILRPLLAFFTLRDIQAGEELCFNYSGASRQVDPDADLAIIPTSSPQSPLKGSARSRAKATTIHAPSTKPGANTISAITATAADSANAANAGAGRKFLSSIVCACGARNCTGRVFA